MLEKPLRKIYYVMSPSLRLLVRRIVFLPKDLFRKKDEMMPPSGLIYTGRGDFIRAGKYWLERFIREGGLKPEDSVLDIGSGIGRMAVPMAKYLTTGRYEGFDAVRQGVDWCKSNIQRKYPNFNFIYADLDNDLYKSKGFNAAEYRFDYPDENFDFAISISVFTHMLKDEIINYLRETSRVLKKGGVLFATFFVLPDDFQPGRQAFDFPYQFGNYALMDKNVKSANVAYRYDFLHDICTQSGFDIHLYQKGYWNKHIEHTDNDFQDVLILRKL